MYCQMAKRPTDTIIGMIFSLKCNLSGMHGECDMMQEKMRRKKETVIELSRLSCSLLRTVLLELLSDLSFFPPFTPLQSQNHRVESSHTSDNVSKTAKRALFLFSHPHHYFSSRIVQNFPFFNFLFRQCLPGGREGDKGPI